MYDFTMFSSALHSVVVPRALRMNLRERLIIPWRLPAWAANTRPVAVTLKRFFALDLVFILGISVSLVLKLVGARLGSPSAGRAVEAGY
jgi:hypothetical protein